MKRDGSFYALFGPAVVGLASLFAFADSHASTEAAFYAQCHALLPIADEFAKECMQRAKPFSRTFYPSGGNRGEKESYSTYFKTLSAPSHFVLGCVLNFEHKLNFVGLYYTARPLDMSTFSEDKVVFIDPNDNVGLDADGIQTTFVAIRQFVTDTIPRRFPVIPKNCEDSGIDETSGSKATGLYHIRQLDDRRFQHCFADHCLIEMYRSFFGMHDAPIIYIIDWRIFIDANGILLLEEKFRDDACKSYKRNLPYVYDIVTEACDSTTGTNP